MTGGCGSPEVGFTLQNSPGIRLLGFPLPSPRPPSLPCFTHPLASFPFTSPLHLTLGLLLGEPHPLSFHQEPTLTPDQQPFLHFPKESALGCQHKLLSAPFAPVLSFPLVTSVAPE